MEAVAEHINEMQKIYEEYGNVLDEMMKNYKVTHPHSKVNYASTYYLVPYNLLTLLRTISNISDTK